MLVADAERCHIDRDMPELIQEEHRSDDEQQMVVTRRHVFGAEIEERQDLRSRRARHEGRILARHAMCRCARCNPDHGKGRHRKDGCLNA
jgi:hypothetical protein